jgi:hypothetical protein
MLNAIQKLVKGHGSAGKVMERGSIGMLRTGMDIFQKMDFKPIYKLRRNKYS